MGTREAPMEVKVEGKEVENGAVVYERTMVVIGVKAARTSGIIHLPDSRSPKGLRPHCYLAIMTPTGVNQWMTRFSEARFVPRVLCRSGVHPISLWVSILMSRY